MSPGAFAPIVVADPRRWYLRIQCTGGSNTVAAAPFPIPAGTAAIPSFANFLEVKWKDAPGLCAGQWMGFGAAGVIFHIWEVFYVGG